MTVPLLAGITARTVTTNRLSTRVLFAGPDDGTPVLFIHGNFSSATWWEETLAALPPQYRGIAPDQRGYGGADPAALIDATRGMGDFVDDALALMDHLGYDRCHLVGNSLGGLVVWWMMADAPERLLSIPRFCRIRRRSDQPGPDPELIGWRPRHGFGFQPARHHAPARLGPTAYPGTRRCDD